jgi:aspartyl-tRNA(Asn)/glutamyl-tRNA(Gln) amidotransferase subunit A
MMQVIAVFDPVDPVCVSGAPVDFPACLRNGIKASRIVYAAGDYLNRSDPEVLEAVKRTSGIFEGLGAQIREAELPWLREAAFANGTIVVADAACYHGERLREHPEWFGDDIRERLEIGAAITTEDYNKARQTQIEVRRRFDEFFKTADFLILPSTPIAAPPLRGESAVELARLLTRFTAPFNLAGIPALSIPCGFTTSGLPIGLQIVSKAWNDAGVLRAGYSYEQATDWHRKRPPEIRQ